MLRFMGNKSFCPIPHRNPETINNTNSFPLHWFLNLCFKQVSSCKRTEQVALGSDSEDRVPVPLPMSMRKLEAQGEFSFTIILRSLPGKTGTQNILAANE